MVRKSIKNPVIYGVVHNVALHRWDEFLFDLLYPSNFTNKNFSMLFRNGPHRIFFDDFASMEVYFKKAVEVQIWKGSSNSGDPIFGFIAHSFPRSKSVKFYNEIELIISDNSCPLSLRYDFGKLRSKISIHSPFIDALQKYEDALQQNRLWL